MCTISKIWRTPRWGRPPRPPRRTPTKTLRLVRRYDYRVRALNGSGPGPWADYAPTSTGPATAPTMPRDLTAEAVGPTSIMLTWTAPASDNGTPITGYQLQRQRLTEPIVDWADVDTDAPLGVGSQAVHRRHRP